MHILTNVSIILVGLAATVCQAEIAIEVPPPEKPFENPTVPSGATPSKIKRKVAPLRLAIDLADGSHIIGVPSIKSVPVQTSYAKMDIPLEKIVSIEITDDHETVSIAFRNGDELKGVVDLSAIELKTIFGKYSIDVEHIREMNFHRGGNVSLPVELSESLLLHYSFDEKGDMVEDKSGMGHDGKGHGARWTPQGKVGGAYEFVRGSYVDGGTHSLGDTDMTLMMWLKTKSVTQDYLFGGWGGGLQMQFTLGVASDRPPNNKLNMYSHISQHRIHSSVDVNDGEWHHIGFQDVGKTMRIFIDGEEKAHGNAGTVIYDNWQWIIGGTNRRGLFTGAIDEVMLFDRALSQETIRHLYNSQK